MSSLSFMYTTVIISVGCFSVREFEVYSIVFHVLSVSRSKAKCVKVSGRLS